MRDYEVCALRPWNFLFLASVVSKLKTPTTQAYTKSLYDFIEKREREEERE